jgi:hypothetical protein
VPCWQFSTVTWKAVRGGGTCSAYFSTVPSLLRSSTGTMWRGEERTAAVPFLAKQVDAPLFDPPVAKLTFRHRHSLLLRCLESSPDCGGPSPVACLPRTRTYYLDLANAKTTVPAVYSKHISPHIHMHWEVQIDCLQLSCAHETFLDIRR